MQLRLLGPMALIADGGPVRLPASRKTRALLGYLAVEGKPICRDRLCHLFWEMPDDPKGALRWSRASFAAYWAKRSWPIAKRPPLTLPVSMSTLRQCGTARQGLTTHQPRRWSGSVPPPLAISWKISTFPIATNSTLGASQWRRTSGHGWTGFALNWSRANCRPINCSCRPRLG